ncbi:hypothetical protein HYH02_006657 [Chlamydomonas schloesseri]|uniref:FAS1 domain-containing protein n=1 Tax=Chlamydomonas schloesseri TaxID=2026947 RepID=A0A835VYJ7_9CHLO|nr:hypothetical protein HYH02_006657 [Chlamydomonas schloesseri]|eukprot:KAG2432670.1 hypothetical protein HYH02_006657 [Chlamydomonas schloesseri]
MSGLEGVFNNTDGQYITLFAPTDAALRAMTQKLGTDPNTLFGLGTAVAHILRYHALNTSYLVADIPVGDTPAPTLYTGQNLTVSKAANGSVVVRSVGSDAQVTHADLTAGGSVVHVIDTMLLPVYTTIASVVDRNPELSYLRDALNSTGLATNLNNPNLNATVFAPVNAAFNASLPYTTAINASVPDILTYHVLPAPVSTAAIPNVSTVYATLNSKANLTVLRKGSTVTVAPVGATPATVTTANISIGLNLPTSAEPRSYVHLVNEVLLPFYTTVANAAERRSLTTLIAAITAINASDPAFLSTVTDRNFRGTVLAPSNDAFTRTLASLNVTADQLLADKDNLRRILNAHIIPNATVFSSQLTNNATLNTTGGALLNVSINNGVVRFNAAKSSAKVVDADVSVGNGRAVVHVIDRVLLPAELTLPAPYVTVAAAAQANGLTLLLDAVTASNLSTILSDPDFNGTVLAPTNGAFSALLNAFKLSATQLLADKANLRRILNAHIITPGAYLSSGLTNGMTLATTNGVLNVSVNGTRVSFAAAKSSAKVLTPNVLAASAVVHTIDYVLIPANVNLTTGDGGAAGMASPSVLTLLSSALAFVALFAFSRF